MRALVVCAAPVVGSAPLVAQLARDADVTVAVDGGGGVCREAGIVPDVLLGDLDSVSEADLEELTRAGSRIVRYDAEKDATDLELALDHVRDLGADEVIVTAATAGRLDHTLGVMASLAGAADLHPMIVEPDLQAWVLAIGGREALSLSDEKGRTVSVMPWGGAVEVSVRGVRWPLEHAVLHADSTLGISNVITEFGEARFVVHAGVAFVLEPEVLT